MGTSIEPAVFALVGTIVGGLISFTTTAWAERRRAQETRAFRNHPERARTAMDFLVAFDNFRRAVRTNDPAQVELSRTHAETRARMGLFFDKSVTEAADTAGQYLVDAMGKSESERRSANAKAKDGRDKTIEAMRVQLGEGKISSRTD
jgi:hypothetical protein